MERKIKLIWDMHGPDAKGTAEHHAIHLGEYLDKFKMTHFGFGSETTTEVHAQAYVIVEEKDMITVRDSLRPQRAELWED